MNFTEKLTPNTIYYRGDGAVYVKVGEVWDTSYEVAAVTEKSVWGSKFYLTNTYYSEMRKITNLEKILLAVESKN